MKIESNDPTKLDTCGLCGGIYAFCTCSVPPYESIITSLGWAKRDAAGTYEFLIGEGCSYFIMSCREEDDGEFLTMINCVDPNTDCNVWENSETHFYGRIKTMHDLKSIMRFLDIEKD